VRRLVGFVAALVIGAAIGLALYLAAVEISFRMPGNGDDGVACRGCGCTDDRACPGGCFWVAGDLCSSCVADEPGGGW
jgi:hypothetical protein